MTVALLIIDMQKEFLTADGMFGDKHIPLEPLISAIKKLVRAARSQIEEVKIVWIRSEYDPQVKSPRICRPVGDPSRTANTGSIPSNSDYLAGTHMAKTRVCCAPGTELADFHPDVQHLIDERPTITSIVREDSCKECILTKTYYSAFSETDLDERLKVLKVKRVAVCGLVANVCVQATSVEAWRHGYEVTLISDATGASSPERHADGVRAISEFGMVSTADQMIECWSGGTFAEEGSTSTSIGDKLGDSNSKSFSVVIAGAGIGGLACAIALYDTLSKAQGSFDIRVIERDASLDERAQGYSLTIQDGMTALNAIGVGDQVRSEAGGVQRSGQHIIDAKSGKVILALGGSRTKSPAAAGGRNVYIPRERLRKILHDKAIETGSISIEWGKRIVQVHDDTSDPGAGLRLHLSDNSTMSSVGLLVAGDGVRSELRHNLLPDSLNFLGVISICGISNTDHPLCIGGSVQVFDPSTRSRLFCKPFDDCQRNEKSQSSVMWQLTMPMEERAILDINALEKENEKRRLFDIVESIVSSWDSSVRDFVLSTPVDRLRGGGLYDRDPSAVARATDMQIERAKDSSAIMSTWCSSSRIAFLGDAAHPMSPFKGQGANQALLDTIEMAECFRSHEIVGPFGTQQKLTAALKRYHASMARRVSHYVLGSRRNVEFTHSHGVGSLETLFPHFGVRDYGAEKAMRQKVLEVNQQLFPERTYAKQEDIFEGWVHEDIDLL